MSWRPMELVHETGANLGARQVVHAVLAFAVFLALGWVVASAAREATTQERDHRANGGLVWMAVDPAGNGVPADRCHSLQRITGVQSSGGILVDVSPALRYFPGDDSLPAVAVTPGTTAVWNLQVATGLVVGADLAESRSFRAGQVVHSDDGPVRVERVLERSPVSALDANLLVTALPEGLVRECWARFAPAAMGDGHDVVEAAFGGLDVDVTPFAGRPDGIPTPAERWTSLTSLRPWLLGASILAMAGVLITLSRRAEVAVYRAFGTSTTALWAMAFLEYVVIYIGSCAAALAMTYGLLVVTHGPQSPEIVRAVAQQVGGSALMAIAISTLSARLAAQGSIVRHLKDR
jgi:hypothetical protein